jgi:cephalosporin-C deacetylase-like acetyl esterase
VGSILLGRSTATYRVWDGMRAIDYLQSRPEIDPHRIGCTGNSGGGTLTSYLMALDERIACAAPSCYLTSLRRLCETIGPQDAEQNVHGQLAYGMDHAEYVTVRAPKPTLMCTATRDFFDISGSWDTFRQAKRVYTRLGFPERVEMVEADQQHGFTQPLRVATVRWMRRWLLKIDDAITEADAKVAADKDLQCTPRGQVMLLEGARSVFELNKELESPLAAARKKFWQENDQAKALGEVRRITGIRRLSDLPEVKCEKQGTTERTGYRVDKLLLRSEEGICLPALAFVPEKRDGDVCLYLHAEGKRAHAAPGGPIEELVRKGRLVLAVDLRGIGETQQSGDSPYAKYLGPEWTDGFLAYLLGKSYLTMRAEDVLVCARFLAGYEAGEKPNRVHLRSWGRVGPPALHAAALEPQLFASVTLHNCLESWTRVVQTPLSRNQFINVVHGALRTYDLPDLLATLPKEKVTWSDPLDALEQPAWK